MSPVQIIIVTGVFFNSLYGIVSAAGDYDDLITFYFHQGYSAFDILGFLLISHNIHLSLSHLRRLLWRLGLRRNGVESDIVSIVTAIERLRSAGFRNVGYKTMWRLLNTQCNLRVTQSTTSVVMNHLDPEGVAARRRHRLLRRVYMNKGPNFLVHIDGNDKLKPFGISIHGAIDGFSRRILWLKAGYTNKDPRHIARLYMDWILHDMRAPRCIRSDEGTENVLVRDIHKAIRSRNADAMNGTPTFLQGRSTANQRIEMFWGILNRCFINFWKDLFKDMRDIELLRDSDPVHLECVRFCFLHLIQMHLNKFRLFWNCHRIRSQRGNDTINGIPDVLYFQPYAFSALDYSSRIPFQREELVRVRDQYTEEYPQFGCREEFLQLVELISGYTRNELVLPENVNDALELFSALVDALPTDN